MISIRRPSRRILSAATSRGPPLLFPFPLVAGAELVGKWGELRSLRARNSQVDPYSSRVHRPLFHLYTDPCLGLCINCEMKFMGEMRSNRIAWEEELFLGGDEREREATSATIINYASFFPSSSSFLLDFQIGNPFFLSTLGRFDLSFININSFSPYSFFVSLLLRGYFSRREIWKEDIYLIDFNWFSRFFLGIFFLWLYEKRL